VTADTAERLMQPPCLLLQSATMIGGQRREQPAVELVAIPGDPRQQFGEGQPRLPRAGAMPGQARRHQHHACKHGARFPPQLGFEFGRGLSASLSLRRPSLRWPGEDAVERHLLEHHPPVAAVLVDPRRIPHPEEIVRPARSRMQEVERPRIDRQLLEHLEIKVGLTEE
jgi:hypothetical protein